MSEERIREAIRQKIREHRGVDAATTPFEQHGRAYKLTGTEQDAKLEREVPKSTQ